CPNRSEWCCIRRNSGTLEKSSVRSDSVWRRPRWHRNDRLTGANLRMKGPSAFLLQEEPPTRPYEHGRMSCKIRSRPVIDSTKCLLHVKKRQPPGFPGGVVRRLHHGKRIVGRQVGPWRPR